MAKKSNKKSTKPAATSENVVRIKAGSSTKSTPEKETPATPAAVKADKPAKAEKKPKTRKGVRGGGALRAIGGYFKGAWVELRQVRWPTRSATWSMTGAVLAYTAFFVILVLLLDAAFKYLFELLLGK